jgi:hypothetical protein
MKQSFDWQTFVAINTPGALSTARPVQRERQKLLDTSVLPAMQEWSNRYQFEAIWEGHAQPAQKRLYACAFSGVTRTLDPHNFYHAWMLGCFSFWGSVLDHYLDYHLISFVRTQSWSLDQKIAYLNERLAFISAPLTAPISLFTQDQSSARSFPDPVKQDSASLLRDALLDLCLSLQRHLSVQIDERRSFFAFTTALGELSQFIGGQQSEVSGTLLYQSTWQHPDDLEVYLTRLRYSIGLRAVAALSLACEAETTNEQDWNRWLPAVESGALVIRLVNDCGGFLREIAEGKPNSVTIALTNLGYLVDARYTLDSTEVVSAMKLVHKRLNTELIRFHTLTSQIVQEAPLTSFGYCILSAVAFITTLYQAGGDYEAPTAGL